MNFVILLWCFLAVFQKWETQGDNTTESTDVSYDSSDIIINAVPDATSFFLNWTVPTDYENIANYVINVKDSETLHYFPPNCTPNITGTIGNVSVTNFTYTEAVPDFYYFIQITAHDIDGTEQISGTVNLTTMKTVPAAPRDVTVKHLQLSEDLNRFSAQVSWKTPCEPNGNLSYYQIFLYQIDTPSTPPINETVQANSQEEYTHVIHSLEPYKNYNLVMFAVESEKGGGENNSNSFFTDVEKLTVTPSANVKNFSLNWNIPNCSCNATYNVEFIRLTPKHFVSQNCSAVIPDGVEGLQSTSYTYTEALADYEYELTIRAYCNNTNNLVANGSATFSTYPTVPGAPTINNDSIFPYLNENNSISLELSWLMPCQPNGNISKYKIDMNGEYIDGGDTIPRTLYVDAEPNQTYYSYLISELMPYSVYVIDVAAVGYETLVGNKSEQQTFETPSSYPGIPTVSIANKTSTSFMITWTPPTNKSGPIRRYDLEVVSLGAQYNYDTTKCSSNNTTHYYNSTNTTFQFTDGRPYFAYNVSVIAVTDAGAGVSGNQTVVTSSSASARPDDLNFVQNNSTTYILTWTVPCQVNGPINYFNISLDGYYTEDNSYINSNVSTETFERDIFNYSTVICLLESFNYTIKVSLVVDENITGEIAELNISSGPGIPGRPVNITINSSVLNSDSWMYWTPPVELKGKLSYEVGVTALHPLYQSDSSCRMPENVTFNSTRLNSTVLKLDLNPFYHYYNYSIAVRALTSAGSGDYNTIYQNSTEGVPDNVFMEHDYPIISNFPTEEYNATATIIFNSPCFLNGRFDNYTLDINISDSRHEQISTTNNSFMLHLEPEQQYNYQIITYNNFLYNTSSITTFQSPAGVPSINIVPHNIPLGLKDNEAVVTLKKEDFQGPNGVVKYLALILTDRNITGGEIEPYENGTWPNITNTQDGLYYQLTEDKWDPFNESDIAKFTIGDGADTCNEMLSYCNRPLDPNTNYYLIVRVYTNNFYRNSPTIHFKTSNIKHLIIILVSIGGVLASALVGFLAFIFWRKKMIQLPGVLYIKSSANTHTPIINTSIPFKKFITYSKFLDNNPDKMKEQYILLSEQSKEVAAAMTTNFAQLTENKRKNRYINILPYDETRVKLLIDEDDDLGSDYINASYIKGYSGQVEYIATQGPLEGTCRDFWKMILQENVSIIVMVSQFIENDRPKCYRYFPRNRDTMLVEEIEIRCSMELHFGIYCVRMLQVRKDNIQANVVHMQFLEWPDFGVPTGTENMLQFCYQIRDRINVEGGCAVIHCSAGVGRTGTLIATDILLQTAKAKKNIDVFNTVLDLRKQRINMVQTEKQYIYIHHLLRDHSDRSPSPDYIVNSCPIYENLSVIKDKSDSETNGECLPKKQPDGNVGESSF